MISGAKFILFPNLQYLKHNLIKYDSFRFIIKYFRLSMPTTILVGDIGSTKSTWWYHTTEDHELHLHGYNPLVHGKPHGRQLFESLKTQMGDTSVSTIWYYGAGVINDDISEEIKNEILALFPTSQVYVSSDLIGAAIAANGKAPGTVAILGTGSHAACWDGNSITRQATSLGYILGDEGSGCDIGKSLIQAYFYQKLPKVIYPEMEKLLPDGRAGFFASLYSNKAPNQYLASFAQVAVQFKEETWVKELIADRFRLFIQSHLVPLKIDEPIHVIGAIGFIFADILTTKLKQAGLSPGKFIQNPSRQLFESHLSDGKKY